jgi:hypothetical protein
VSGLLTHAVAIGTVSVLTLQSQTNRLCRKAAGIRRHVAALLLVRNVPARAVTGSIRFATAALMETNIVRF